MENPMIERQESDEEQTKSSSNLSDDSAVNPTKKARPRLTFPFGACRVCSDSATGIHYGIATCEGCKGFFKRSILRKEKYRCYFDNACVINVTNRNRCKACRFRRCLDEGMSVDGVKMGRIPKLVKERALKEQREQQMREKQAENQLEEGRPREASCSSSASDQSIENDDPNPMETDTSKFSLTNSRRTTDLQPMKTNSDTERTKINESSNLKTISKRKLEFLPDDFTIDETVGLSPNPFEPMPRHQLPWIRAIAEKFRGNPLKLVINLTQEETNFIDYIRQATYQTYLRHSKRVNQLECRMVKMIYEGIDDSLDDTTTVEEFLETVPKILEVIMRSAVFNVQELPGMHFMDGGSLQKLILHRAYDWFLLKYSTLLNSNGHCYFIAVNGFRYTRRWLNFFYGTRMTNEMFDFAQTLRDLNLTDRERALLLPLRLCHPDSTSDQEEIPRLLYSCYLSALHEEFKHHHGDHKSKVLLNKVLQVLDLLTPLADAYQKNVGSRLVQA